MKKQLANSRQKHKKGVLSLFSGCGGMDLGFEGGFTVLRNSINEKIHPKWIPDDSVDGNWVRLPRTFFETLFANDIQRAARASWVPYFSKESDRSNLFQLNSIVDLVKRHRQRDFEFPKADIVTGGFPCQDFSVAGKRKGFDSHKGHHGKILSEGDNPTEENRGKLYMWMRHVVDIVRPKVFIAENVKGLVSLPNVKKIIQKDFSQIGSGYHVVEAKLLFAPKYGVPQSRERVIFMGFRKDALLTDALEALSKEVIPVEYDPYPIQTHGTKEQSDYEKNNLVPYVTVGDYLLDLPEPEASLDLAHQTYSKAKWYGKHCQGQTEVNLEGVGPTIRAEHHGNIEFRRLQPEHGGRYGHEFKANLKERRLSVRECARIQTFPDDFEFVRRPSVLGADFKISGSEAYKLIGNAVPPLLAFHIAWRLQEIWPKLMK